MPRLTLSADSQIIEKARQLARNRGTSVSVLFSEYVEMMTSPRPPQWKSAPITRRLRGLAKVPATMSDCELFEQAISAKCRP